MRQDKCTWSLVAMPLMSSTRGMTGTGFMKCIPTCTPKLLCSATQVTRIASVKCKLICCSSTDALEAPSRACSNSSCLLHPDLQGQAQIRKEEADQLM